MKEMTHHKLLWYLKHRYLSQRRGAGLGVQRMLPNPEQGAATQTPGQQRTRKELGINISQWWFWPPSHLSAPHCPSRYSQAPSGILPTPSAQGQAGNFHVQALQGLSSPVLCLSLPDDKRPWLLFTSRCAESLAEIKPLYSEVNDACFAARSPSLLSSVPSTECRCHRWCNSIPLKGFCLPFLEPGMFSLNSNQISGLNWLSRVKSLLQLPCLPAQISLTVASPGMDLPIFH